MTRWLGAIAVLALAGFGAPIHARDCMSNDGKYVRCPEDATRRHAPARPASAASRELVALINAKLARWVHPTGQCGFGSTERLATFYWQGTRTASGERFDAHGLTAAHRTLPFGTQLHVRNPHNGRAVTVRINDRGPATNAWIDLSLGAAQALGLKQSSYVCVDG